MFCFTHSRISSATHSTLNYMFPVSPQHIIWQSIEKASSCETMRNRITISRRFMCDAAFISLCASWPRDWIVPSSHHLGLRAQLGNWLYVRNPSRGLGQRRMYTLDEWPVSKLSTKITNERYMKASKENVPYFRALVFNSVDSVFC